MYEPNLRIFRPDAPDPIRIFEQKHEAELLEYLEECCPEVANKFNKQKTKFKRYPAKRKAKRFK